MLWTSFGVKPKQVLNSSSSKVNTPRFFNPVKTDSFETRNVPVMTPLYRLELSLNAPLNKFCIKPIMSS